MNDFNNLGLNGKCGWVCRQLNNISSAVSSIPFVGKIAGGYLSQLVEYVEMIDNFLFKGIITEEPTPQEEIILNAFSTKFSVFIKNIVTSLDQALATNQVNFALVNKELAKICIASEYFFYNEKEGLSQNAINIRHKLIQQSITSLRQSVEAELGSTGLIVKVLANQSDFNGLFVNSVAGQSYLCKQYQTATNQSGSFASPTKTIATKNDELIDLSFSAQPFNSEPIKPNPNDDLLNPNDSKIDIDKTFKYVSYGLLAITAFGVVKSIFKKKQQ